jgi:predicted ATPase/DNA-binding SARP family transcriptional activator
VRKSARPTPFLFLFGAPRLERGGAPVEIDTRKALALFAYLAVTRQSHSRDTLATLLWSEYDQTRARAALRRTLSVLHTALAGEQLDIDREAIGLTPGAKLYVDVDEFHKRLADCARHGHPENETCARCITPLSEAAALYRDDFMAGFTLRDSPAFDEWQFFQTETLRRELAGALEKLAHHHSAQREFDHATVYARRWLALDPLHEPAHRQLMQLYARTNQRAAALRQYQELSRVLQKELGVQPLEETTRLYESIKRGGEGEMPAAPLHPRASAPQPFPLVGRAAEWDALRRAYGSLHADGQFIILQGEAGVGKTRLAEAFLDHARTKRAVVLAARCYEGETNLAYTPFIEALRAAMNPPDHPHWLHHVPAHFAGEAIRLLPELATLVPGLPPLPPLDSPGAQSRFFEGISQVLLTILRGAVPGVFLIDDLQWIDPASLDLLTYIVQRLRGRPLCIVGTWRDDALPAGTHLRRLLAGAQRAGTATHIAIARLSESAVMELVAAVPGAPREIGARLYRETEGLPLFVVEYLAAIQHDPHAPSDWSLPGSAREMLRARLLDVSETSTQLLTTAAVIGRSFDFETLREASGRSEEETVAALEELLARGLIKEITGSERALAYDFTHEKLRALVDEETSQARRRLLHRRVAEALATRARLQHQTGALAAPIAHHYAQAGQNAQAAEYFKLAGEHARSLYANAAALAHFRAALDLGHPEQAALHIAIGDLETLDGDYRAAFAAYETAAKLLAPKIDAALEHKRGNLHHRRGDWKLAEEHFQAALDAWGNHGSVNERARLYADWSRTAHRQDHAEQAASLAQRALELAQQADDTPALAQAHNILGILASGRGDQARAREHLEQSVQLAERLNAPDIRVAALNNLALAYGAGGEIVRAIELTQTALELCQTQGDRHRQAALHNNLADLLHHAGQTESAMEHLKQAVAIFAEIGEDPGALQPEIWKLVEW